MKLSYPEVRRLCLKPDEARKPLYPRVITHAVSTRLIWVLQDAPLTANQITFLSMLTAFAALPFFAGLSSRSALIGALVIELYYVFDAMDGQWARLKRQGSITGAFFDYLINYAFHPPLLFAIGWGVYKTNGDPLYLVLGASAGFACLWVLLIWNVRAAILLPHVLARKGAAFAKPAEERSERLSSAKWLFSWLHKLLVFPWFMHVLSAASVLSFATGLATDIFSYFLLYYGLVGPAVAVILTAQWIFTKRLDKSAQI